MLKLSSILSAQSNVLEGKKVKLVRHKDNRADYRKVMKDKAVLLGDYQRIQPKAYFKDCDYLLVFIGLERRKSVFVEAYRVNGVQEIDGKFHYDLEEMNHFNVYRDRLVIDWGGSERSWHQWFPQNDKEVLEILPDGYVGEFSGLLDFTLQYDELCQLIAKPDANREWKQHLSSVNGIYLILDQSSGQQYVGSAYGQQGIWGRWEEYARSGHGHNKELINLLDSDPLHAKHFQFTVLQSLPSNLSSKEVVTYENLYKKKLGSKAFGLNQN